MKNLSIQKTYDSISLLSKNLVKEHKKKHYNYLHIGLIQVAAKPLHRLGIIQLSTGSTILPTQNR